MGNYTSKDENLAEQSAIPARIGLAIPPNSPNTTGGSNQTPQSYAAGLEDNRFYNSNSNSAQNEDGYT